MTERLSWINLRPVAQKYEYITIRWVGTSESGKTDKYDVLNNRSGDRLGVIKWFGRWRQYVFIPDQLTVYSRGCMCDIAEFVASLR